MSTQGRIGLILTALIAAVALVARRHRRLAADADHPTTVAGPEARATGHARDGTEPEPPPGADPALLRSCGVTDPSVRPGSAPVVSLVTVSRPAPEPIASGTAQTVRFRAVRRDGAPVSLATVTLLDHRGRDVSNGPAGADGRGEVQTPRPGSYVLVSTAPGHQPGVVALTVAETPAAAEIVLTRSASVSGTVHGGDGPIAGARVTLGQDGVLVDAVHTGPGGTYRIGDLAGDEYGLCLTAAGYEPTTTLLRVPDETDLRHDVHLDPARLPTENDRAEDRVSGPR